MSDEFYWIAVAVVIVMSAARLTRLVIADKFPPVVALRNAYAEWTEGSNRRFGYQVLVFCGYCFAPWVTLLIVGTAMACGVFGDPASPVGTRWPYFLAWWLINGWLAISYVSALVVSFDLNVLTGKDDD